MFARTTGTIRSNAIRPPKLTPQQRLLNFLMFLKHDNSAALESSLWNWSRSSVNDDSIFIASCICMSASNEIRWPNDNERLLLAQKINALPGCIGFIDGTLFEIRRPYDNPAHRNWFNGRKKIYCFNNTVVVDHHGLFIYIDSGYPGKFHDVNILRSSELCRSWRD